MPADNPLIQAINLQNLGRIDEAAALFRQILAKTPTEAAALYSLSLILLNQGDTEGSLKLAEFGTQVAPTFAPMWHIKAAGLAALGRKAEALLAYDKTLEIEPNMVEALLNSGVLLRDMFRHRDALERFNRILAINPDREAALGNCAILLSEFKQNREAIAMFERLLRINPDFDYGLGLLSYERLHVCDWTDFAPLTAQIREGIRAGRRACKTLALMALSDSVTEHFLAARAFAFHRMPRAGKALWRGERYNHQRLRLAYISPDLREHPVGHLMAGIFEHHDKSRFETVAISLGLDDQSRLRGRMIKAFDHFIDAREMGSRQIAELMRSMEIDIAVDLAGYTSDSRTDIFSWRPAPIHINYLGYPGTLGVDYMDYILADRHIIPKDHQPFFSERVAYLPDTYLPTDSGIKIAERTPTRAECGLPDTGIVFCSFSHDYKISPPIFDIWMRLLQQVPGSVLWLMSRNELSQQNLRKEAGLRGIAPERLVFANRVPLVEDHLARYRQADLFLDTHPYNAHTTAADALMAGLPVVTYMGDAFPARVAGSLLHAIGMEELATHSLADYEALALALASDPARLTKLKQKLVANRANSSLFNTEKFCRNLENAYLSIWQNHDALGLGLPTAAPQ